MQIIAVGCMFVGVFDSDKLAYGLFIAVFVAIAHPHFGVGPNTKIGCSARKEVSRKD